MDTLPEDQYTFFDLISLNSSYS